MDYNEWKLHVLGGQSGVVGCRFEGIITDWGEDLDSIDRLYTRAYFKIVDMDKFNELEGDQKIISYLLDELGFDLSNCNNFPYGIKEVGSFVEGSRNRAYSYLGFDSRDKNMTERVFNVVRRGSNIFFGWEKNEPLVSLEKGNKVWIEKVEDNKKLIGIFDEIIMKIVREYEKNSLFLDVIYLSFNWKGLMLLADWLKPKEVVMKSNGMDKIIVGMRWGICFIVDKELELGMIKFEFKKNGEKKIETRYLDEF